jgi:hypothetical protein
MAKEITGGFTVSQEIQIIISPIYIKYMINRENIMEPVIETKNIPTERWGDFCDTFTNGNRGRKVNITLVKAKVGERLAEGTIFSAIDYDPEGKGDVFMISYGDEAPLTIHVVNTPLELWQAQNEVGKVILLEIIDAEERKLMIEFL